MMKKTAMWMVAGGLTLGLAQGALADNDVTRPYEAELMADAKAKSSYLAAEGSGGWDGTFYLSDSSGANRLNIGGYEIIRYDINFSDHPSGSTNEDFTHGFSNRRTRINLGGTVFEPAFRWRISFNFDDSGAAELRDAFLEYKMDNGMWIKVGQFKAGYLWEELVGLNKQLVLERSAAHQTFTAGRVQGIEFGYAQDKFRIMGSFSDGAQTDNTPFDSTDEADWALIARGEYMWAGDDWKRFEDFTSFRGQGNYAGKAGAAIAFQDGGSTGAVGGATADINIFAFTVDAAVEGDGWNAFAALIFQMTDDATLPDSLSDIGFVAQGGYFVTDQTELYLRWDAIFPDDARIAPAGNNADPFNSVAFGFWHYVSPNSHALKVGADVVFYLEAADNTVVVPNTIQNYVSTTEDGQFAVRAALSFGF